MTIRPLTVSLLFLLSTCFVYGEQAPAAEPSFANLTLYRLEPQPVQTEQVFDGVVEAVNQSTVSAQTSGRVLDIPVDVGDAVKKGDLIVRLTDTEQRARVSRSQAQYNEALAQFKRLQDLFGKRLIARSELDQAEASYKSAEAALREAKENLAYTRIYAPYEGLVLNRHIRAGESVAPGTPLMTGLSLEALRVRISVPQQGIGAVRQYQTASLLMADRQPLISTDLRIAPSADPNTHSFPVLVNLPEGSHGLSPGTMVKIAFTIGMEEKLLIPAKMVAHRGEVTGVYVVDKERVQFRFVRLGSLNQEQLYPVLAGLQAGDQVAEDPILAAAVYKQTHLSESAN